MSVAKHLLELTNQSVAQLESVHFYEMWDEPAKSLPENHFGLTLDLATPKVNLFLASAFSGGTLAAAESAETGDYLSRPLVIEVVAGAGAVLARGLISSGGTGQAPHGRAKGPEDAAGGAAHNRDS